VTTTSLDAATVIVPVHSPARWNGLLKAVNSALVQRPAPQSVIVVVDHHDELLERSLSHFADQPTVSVIRNTLRPGASGARNTGAFAATTPVLVFLDSDVRAYPCWLKRLVSALGQERVVGSGGAVVPCWQATRPAWFPDEFLWVVGATYQGQATSAGPIRNVWSENMAVRADLFHEVGGFRTDFSKVGDVSRPEDTDLCIRIAAASTGGRWLYLPDAIVEHDVGPERTSFLHFLARSYSEGRGKVELARLNQGVGALDKERAWLAKTVPTGVARYLRESVRKRDPHLVLRAGAAILGTGSAGVGAAGAMLRSVHTKGPSNGV